MKEKLSVWNGRHGTWQKIKRELMAYLNQIKNELGVPLYYVIRDPNLEDQYRAASGEIGNRIYEAHHKGRIYENNAFQVLQIRQWTSGGRAEAHVANSNNVQDAWHDAWHSIILAFKGHDAKAANIATAHQDLKDAHWSENKKNWSLDDFCSVVWKANNELNQYNANIDPKSQVTALLQGIRADSRINPQLLAIIVSN
jgi:hypothetical protein